MKHRPLFQRVFGIAVLLLIILFLWKQSEIPELEEPEFFVEKTDEKEDTASQNQPIQTETSFVEKEDGKNGEQKQTSKNLELENGKQDASDNIKSEDGKQDASENIKSEDSKRNASDNLETEGNVENVPAIAPETILSVEEIQQMDAGSTLDLSSLEETVVDNLFYIQTIEVPVLQRILGVSYQENPDISIEELRYLRVLYFGFDGQTHIGELLVNQSIAEEVLEIMRELYRQTYPIEKMVLIDEYGADDEASMSDNNTSAFNYRNIAGSSRLSRHSLGFAIDINPKYNPYVKTDSNGELVVSPSNSGEFADRSKEFEHKIDENDLCYQLFTNYGFTWGGNWNSVKDYQHFEK